jgi:hypothetical protein
MSAPTQTADWVDSIWAAVALVVALTGCIAFMWVGWGWPTALAGVVVLAASMVVRWFTT